MAKKKKVINKRKKATKAGFSKMDKKLLDASEAILTVSIETGKKWHKFIKKTVTTVEPIREKQIDMFFDTTEAVITQVEAGADKFKSRLGIQEDISDMVKKQLDKKKILELLKANTSKLVSIANPDGLKKTIEAGAVKLKMEIEERFSPKKSKVKSKAKVAKKKKKKAKKKKTVKASKATKAPKTTKRKIAAKPKATKKAVAKKPAAKKTPAKASKPAASKRTVKRKAVTKKATATRTAKPSASKKRVTSNKKDDLKLIYGIGPKMESTLAKQGVKTYDALSKMAKTKLQKIIDGSGFAYKSYKANHWTQQATFASKGQYSKMNAWVDKNMK